MGATIVDELCSFPRCFLLALRVTSGSAPVMVVALQSEPGRGTR